LEDKEIRLSNNKDHDLIVGFMADPELTLEEKIGWVDIYVDRFGPLEASGLNRSTIELLNSFYYGDTNVHS